MSQIFADNLRHLMQSTGIKNVNDLSRRVRIAQPTLFRWLAAEAREPRHSSIMPIANYFGVTIDDLLTRDLSDPDRPYVVDLSHLPPYIAGEWKEISTREAFQLCIEVLGKGISEEEVLRVLPLVDAVSKRVKEKNT
jgi:transcriptional regulator with XRE-family HTH domain